MILGQAFDIDKAIQAKTLLQLWLRQILLYFFSNTVITYNNFFPNLLQLLIQASEVICQLHSNVTFSSLFNIIVVKKFYITLILTNYLIISQVIYFFC